MNKVEKIKAEIERLIKAYSPIQSIEGKYRVEAYKDLISFIDSLPDTEKDFGIKESVIPFGAFDSELMHQEISIPEGFTATIEGNKIILTRTENEDERIRKEIINYFAKGKEYLSLCSIGKDDILAWLEKQGETFTKKDVDDAYVEGMAFAKYELEKQGEQKPKRMISAEAKEAMYDKPAWSEEDEISIAINNPDAYRIGFADGEAHAKEEMSLAWGEEDECYMSECIGAIATKDGWSFEEKRKTKHWLKSLKQRCTWKPSDEQLEFLQKCIEAYNEVTFPTEVRVLSSLYNDLKKLREE